MFIEKRYPNYLQSRRDDMFIDHVKQGLFSPVGTICLSNVLFYTYRP